MRYFYKRHQCVYTKRLICISWKDICSPRTLNGSAVTIFSPVAIVNIHCFPSIIPIRRSESYILHCSDRRNKEMAPFGSLMYAGSSLICKLISQEGCGKALDLTLKLYRRNRLAKNNPKTNVILL